MGDFKYQFIRTALESRNNLGFHSSIPEAMEEVAAGAAEDTDVEVMAVSVVMAIVAEKDMMEGAVVKTHTNFPAGTEKLC